MEIAFDMSGEQLQEISGLHKGNKMTYQSLRTRSHVLRRSTNVGSPWCFPEITTGIQNNMTNARRSRPTTLREHNEDLSKVRTTKYR
jgi:hypothetical protein